MQSGFEHLHCVGLPAIAVSEDGRITTWNQGAETYFSRGACSVLGQEWHSVIRTLRADGCCAFCSARRALRDGRPAPAMEVTLSIDGYHRNVTMIPIPAPSGRPRSIEFLLLAPELLGSTASRSAEPVPIHPRIRALADDRIIESLTVREREIMACIVEGLDARSIAAQLGISHATARNYVQRILTKLGARNKAEAVNLALTYNLLAS